MAQVAQVIREWVLSYEQCIRKSRIDCSLTRPCLQNSNDHLSAPEYAMQCDLVTEVPPSGQTWTCFTAFLPTQHLTKTPNKLLKLKLLL